MDALADRIEALEAAVARQAAQIEALARRLDALAGTASAE